MRRRGGEERKERMRGMRGRQKMKGRELSCKGAPKIGSMQIRAAVRRGGGERRHVLGRGAARVKQGGRGDEEIGA